MKRNTLFIVILCFVSLMLLGCESQENKRTERQQKGSETKMTPPTTQTPEKLSDTSIDKTSEKQSERSEAEIQRALQLIQSELDRWDDDTGDGGRWEKQKVSWNGKSFIVEIEMMSFADIRPGNPMPNSLAQNEYLRIGYESVKKYASGSPCRVLLLFGGRVVNSRDSHQ